MIADPQVNPLIVFPALFALGLMRWKQTDGRVQGAVLMLIGVVDIFYFHFHAPLF